MKKLLIAFACFLLGIGLYGQCEVSITDSTPASCFGDCDGSLTAVATGTGPFTYIWSHGSTQATTTGLCAGTYGVTITDADGCESVADSTVSAPTEIQVTIDVSNNECSDPGPASARARVSGGAPNYTFVWSTGATTPDLENVPPGTYSVTATDAIGCTGEASVSIIESLEFTLEVTSTALTCTGDEDVTLTAVAEGESSGYLYFWNNGEATASITVPRGSTYSVTVTNEIDCALTQEVDTRVLSTSLSSSDENCGEPGGLSARAFPRGGTPPYTYTWSPDVPAPGEREQADLTPGTYFLTVTDATNCEVTNSVVVAEASELIISFSNIASTCFNACNGTAMAEVNGGIPPYAYLWSDGNTAASSSSLCEGDYFVTVTDSNGCEAFGTVTIEPQSEITVSGTTTGIDCNGDCTGTIQLEVAGGVAPYQYFWADDFGGITENSRTGLCAGVYSVTVTDANDCAVDRFYEITETGELTATYSLQNACSEDGPSSDSLTVNGGTMPYEYLWNDGSSGATIPRGDDPFAAHAVTITDQNGCTTELNELIGYELFQEEGQVLALLACQSEIMLPNDPPAGYTRTIITSEGDTVSGMDYLIEEAGTYTFLDLSASQSCLRRGSITVFDNSLRDEVSLYALDAFNCDMYNCLAVSGLTDVQLTSEELSITFSDPDGNPVPADENRQFCEVDAPGIYTVEVVLGCDTVRRSLEVVEPVACSTLSGYVYAETASNCTLDVEDIPVPETLVRILGQNGTVYHAISSPDGYFEITVPAGTYALQAVPNGELLSNVCPEQTVSVSSAAAASVDLFLFASPECYDLRTWVSSVTVRRCGFVNRLSVFYDNNSLETAENVQLTLELDPLYKDILTPTPIASEFGNVLTFDLGTLEPFAFGRIDVFFQVECEAELGQTHCVRSIISPAGFCDEDGGGEALVNITEARCEGDSILFRVRNIGDQLMSVPLQYVVVEDGIMMRTDPFIEEALAPDEIFDIILPATGATYQVITNQQPGVVVENDPSWALEGCTTSSSSAFTTGLVNILPIGNGVPWEDVVCRENTGSFDPNDKYGYPRGYDGGQIEPGTRIDYDIRFQNTGTDTAFTVVIRDTLTEALDISTLKMEGGSHDYVTTLDTNRILTITFNNILLVDSLTNEPLSHGIVSFSIDHAPGLQPGDAIDNRVGIYFDFNEPVITNLSHHEIASEPLPNTIRYLSPNPITLNVFPNPVTDELHVNVLGEEIQPDQQLIVTDLSGREVARANYAAAINGWNIRELPAGYYMLVLLDDTGLALGRSGFVRQ